MGLSYKATENLRAIALAVCHRGVCPYSSQGIYDTFQSRAARLQRHQLFVRNLKIRWFTSFIVNLKFSQEGQQVNLLRHLFEGIY
ncbi:hypothetical protein M407DRAFT_139234 [Tulasnella calospora MUT 4182]|uniref:Uncharacterized protein n=1 Tax=Tulasnella calospora MUT 4182 TaxID=1051891 RepID=A0A0C3MBV3_9AGAM|nr:hypothetical protein M407DRAFT_139234 [Tulasnella calospora MUT 4182]